MTETLLHFFRKVEVLYCVTAFTFIRVCFVIKLSCLNQLGVLLCFCL